MTTNNQAVEAAEREKFEQWFLSEKKGTLPDLRMEGEWYYWLNTARLWDAWLARATLSSPVAEVAAPVGPIFEVFGTDAEGVDHVLEVRSSHHFGGSIRIHTHLPASRAPVAVGVEPVSELKQFLSDVVTAAGLLAYGRQDKALSARIANAAYRLRAQQPVAWAVYLVSGQALEQKSVFFGRGNAEELACTIKGVTEIRPLYATQPAGAGASVGRERRWTEYTPAGHPISVVDGGPLDSHRAPAQKVVPVAEPVGAMSNTKRKKLLNLMQKCGGRPTKKLSEDGPRLIVSAEELERFLAAQPILAQDAKDARSDSVHLAGGAGGEVHAPGPTDVALAAETFLICLDGYMLACHVDGETPGGADEMRDAAEQSMKNARYTLVGEIFAARQRAAK